MNVRAINMNSVVYSISRKSNVSKVTISFDKNNINISASMNCQKSLSAEKKARAKILLCLGFSLSQIKLIEYE